MVKINVHMVEIIVHDAQDNTINVLEKLNVYGRDKNQIYKIFTFLKSSVLKNVHGPF